MANSGGTSAPRPGIGQTSAISGASRLPPRSSAARRETTPSALDTETSTRRSAAAASPTRRMGGWLARCVAPKRLSWAIRARSIAGSCRDAPSTRTRSATACNAAPPASSSRARKNDDSGPADAKVRSRSRASSRPTPRAISVERSACGTSSAATRSPASAAANSVPALRRWARRLTAARSATAACGLPAAARHTKDSSAPFGPPGCRAALSPGTESRAAPRR